MLSVKTSRISSKKLILLAYVSISLVAASCGKQSVQDNLNQELDRNRESASVLTSAYKAVEGQYVSDEAKDPSKYWTVLDIHVISVQKDGNLVPQPTLAGYFQLWAKNASSSRDKTIASDKSVTFPFSTGTYDPGNNLLAITLSSSSTNTIYVSCNVANLNRLLCTWIPTGGQVRQYSFILNRVK